MELGHLKYFFEVAKQGSFSKASKTLRISQPSISKMVKLLENQEGYTFLDREKKGVRLTPMGRILYDKCEKIFNDFDDLKKSLDTRKAECQGELWVGASDNLCNYVLPPLITSFLKQYPKVQLKLFAGVASAIVQQLKDFHVELGLFYTAIKDTSLVAEELTRVEFVLVIGAPALSHSNKRNRSRLTTVDLSGMGYVGSLASDYQRPYPALQMLRSIGLNPRTHIEVNQQETQKKLVEAGLGYSLLPEHMVRSDIENGVLLRIALPKRVTSPVFLVRRKSRTLSNVASCWHHFLRDELRKNGKTIVATAPVHLARRGSYSLPRRVEVVISKLREAKERFG